MNQRRDRKGVFLSSLADRRAALQLLQQRRDELLANLNALLEGQHDLEQQQCSRLRAQRQLEVLSAEATRKQAECATVRELAESQNRSNQSRRASIGSKAAQLTTARLSVAPLVLPQELRTHEMAVLHAWAPLRPPAHVHVPSSASGSLHHPSASGPNISPPSTARAAAAASQDPSGAGAFPMSQSSRLSHMTGRPSGDGTASGTGSGAVAAAQPTMAHAGGGISVSLCGLRLPDSLVGAQSAQQAQALCAALGYALLLLDLAAAYLGSPLLHEGSFQGSTSVVWQQQTFWNRRPANSHAVLPLFMEPGLVAAAVAPLALTAKGKSSTSSGWAALPLVRALTSASSNASSSLGMSSGNTSGGLSSFLSGGSDASASSGGAFSETGVGNGGGSSVDRKHADLKLAFDMMQRSCLCLVRHCASGMSQAHGGEMSLGQGLQGPGSSLLHGGSHASRGSGQQPGGGLPLPLSWSAWGCLVVLCAAVLQEEADSGQAAGVASRLGGVLPAALLALRAESSAPHTWPAPAAQSGPSGHDDLADDEGWDVVHTVLPPPPSSSSDDVEQYARAMGLEGGGQQAGGQASSLVSPLTRALSLRGGGSGRGGSGGGATGGSPGGGEAGGAGAGVGPGALRHGEAGGGGFVAGGQAGQGVVMASSPLNRLGSLLRGGPQSKGN